MADQLDGMRIACADAAVGGYRTDTVSLTPEPRLGVAKLQLAEADFDDSFGVPAPPACRTIMLGDIVCAWLAPGEYLVIGDRGDITRFCETVAARLSGVLSLLVDLSHSRASYVASGQGAPDALANHCPLDLAERSFPAGAVARSLFGDAGLFVARLDDVAGQPCFRLIVDQTMAPYLVRLMTKAAKL